MNRLVLALCAAALPFLALPKAADADTDLAEQYGTARAAFLPFGTDPVAARAGVAGQLQAAVGAWTPMSVGVQGAPGFDASLMEAHCGRGGGQVEAPPPQRFTLTRQRGAHRLTRNFDHVGLGTSQQRVDDAEFLEFMGVTIDTNPAMAISMLAQAPRFGLVTVLWPGADAMVILPQAGPAEIWLRCP